MNTVRSTSNLMTIKVNMKDVNKIGKEKEMHSDIPGWHWSVKATPLKYVVSFPTWTTESLNSEGDGFSQEDGIHVTLFSRWFGIHLQYMIWWLPFIGHPILTYTSSKFITQCVLTPFFLLHAHCSLFSTVHQPHLRIPRRTIRNPTYQHQATRGCVHCKTYTKVERLCS